MTFRAIQIIRDTFRALFWFWHPVPVCDTLSTSPPPQKKSVMYYLNGSFALITLSFLFSLFIFLNDFRNLPWPCLPIMHVGATLVVKTGICRSSRPTRSWMSPPPPPQSHGLWPPTWRLESSRLRHLTFLTAKLMVTVTEKAIPFHKWKKIDYCKTV